MVAVGLTLVEPLAVVEVNVPGVIAIEVAPLVAQLSVLLVPGFTLVGFALNDVIVGAEPPFPDVPDEVVPAQLVSPRHAHRISTRIQTFGADKLRPRKSNLLRQKELAESIDYPLVAASAPASVVITHSSGLLVSRTESVSCSANKS